VTIQLLYVLCEEKYHFLSQKTKNKNDNNKYFLYQKYVEFMHIFDNLYKIMKYKIYGKKNLCIIDDNETQVLHKEGDIESLYVILVHLC
jgi:hypothetical protein